MQDTEEGPNPEKQRIDRGGLAPGVTQIVEAKTGAVSYARKILDSGFLFLVLLSSCLLTSTGTARLAAD